MTQIYFRRIICLILIILPFTGASPYAEAISCSLSVSADYTKLIMDITTDEEPHDKTGLKLLNEMMAYEHLHLESLDIFSIWKT